MFPSIFYYSFSVNYQSNFTQDILPLNSSLLSRIICVYISLCLVSYSASRTWDGGGGDSNRSNSESGDDDDEEAPKSKSSSNKGNSSGV